MLTVYIYVHTYMFSKYCSVLSPPIPFPLPPIPPFSLYRNYDTREKFKSRQKAAQSTPLSALSSTARLSRLPICQKTVEDCIASKLVRGSIIESDCSKSTCRVSVNSKHMQLYTYLPRAIATPQETKLSKVYQSVLRFELRHSIPGKTPHEKGMAVHTAHLKLLRVVWAACAHV